MKTMLAVDGNSILNRAFYGIRPLTTKEGLHTNAVYGMINILLGKLEQIKPDYTAVAFDLKEPTFRHEKYELYKANRKGMPDELAMQLPYAKECMEAMGLHVLAKAGYEADDILGTLGEVAKSNGIKLYILTGDRDSLQLICDDVTVLLATNTETITFDRAAFYEKYKIQPENFVDVKALMGDSSDNIPGVAGIGEKTALKLISEYNDLETLFDNYIDSTLSAGLKQKLETGKENAYLSRYLARINTEVPLCLSLDELEFRGYDKDKLYTLFTQLEFSAFIKRLSLGAKSEANAEYTEITGTDKLTKDRIYAAALKDDRIYLCDGENNYSLKADTENLKGIFEDELKICVYDYKQTYHKLKDRGVTYSNCYFDITLAAYIANASGRAYKLSELASKYLGSTYDDDNGDEATMVYKLYKTLDESLNEGEKKLLDDIEIPLAAVLAEMERVGFKVDKEGLSSFSKLLETRANELADEIYDLAGCTFNINSPKQLGEILFEKLELPAFKKTKSGYSTNAEVLEKLRPYHPIIDKIFDYRQLTKLNSTYAVGLLKVADEKGRVHTSFNQTIAATGRLSSTEPNLQNIPIRTELGRELRRYFISENEDYILIDADYSQIELRLLAAISGDETMTEAFREGIDIHTLTASQVFRVFPEDVTSELRKRAKAVNFGIVYGIGDYSLSVDLGVSKKEAGQYIRGYLDTYPEIDKYLKDVVKDAHRDGYVTTLLGRRRYIPELTSSKKQLISFGERVAMNSPIQGSAADIIKLAMINTARKLKEEKIDARLILQVHDELIVESHKDCADKAAEILKQEMEHAYETSVPLTVDISRGRTWYDAK